MSCFKNERVYSIWTLNDGEVSVRETSRDKEVGCGGVERERERISRR